MGGSKRPELNQPANLLVLCGSGTTGCHGRIESDRSDAIEAGIILYSQDVPEQRPFQDNLGQWWNLDNQGHKTPHPPVETGVGSVDTTGRDSTVTATIETTDTKNDLESVRNLTQQIRQRQRDIEGISHERRAIIQRLRRSRVTYREIAESMGTTEQNVYKILRDYIAQQNAT
jgi:hypothetical protein